MSIRQEFGWAQNGQGIYREPEGREKRGGLRRTCKDGIYTAMSEKGLRMGEWNNRRQWSMEDGRRRHTF
jgi:hypothetical protein